MRIITSHFSIPLYTFFSLSPFLSFSLSPFTCHCVFSTPFLLVPFKKRELFYMCFFLKAFMMMKKCVYWFFFFGFFVVLFFFVFFSTFLLYFSLLFFSTLLSFSPFFCPFLICYSFYHTTCMHGIISPLHTQHNSTQHTIRHDINQSIN